MYAPTTTIRTLRRFFVVLPCVYLTFLIGVSLQRSGGRQSVLLDPSDTSSESISDQVSPTASRVQLQEFHRVEIRDGRPVWEVQAHDAKYFPLDHVTHVNDAELVLFRDKGEKVSVHASSAKLYLAGEGLLRAVLEGKTRISSDDRMSLDTEGATFDSAKGEFATDSSVAVSGQGFDVQANRMTYDVASAVVMFAGGVSSRFVQGAELPTVATTGIR